MFKIIEDFINIPNNNQLIKYSGALSAISGLFLSIPTSTNNEVKSAIMIIQFFWLFLLTITITSLFISFIKFSWRKEKELFSLYKQPFVGIFSLFIGSILIIIILNIWRYIINLYGLIFTNFILMFGFPSVVTMGIILFDIFITKRKEKIPLILNFIINSISMGALLSLSGFYIQFGITHLFYQYWFFSVLPISSIILFVILIGLAIYRKNNIFKPYR